MSRDVQEMTDKQLRELICEAQAELDTRDRFRYCTVTHYLTDDVPVFLSLREDRGTGAWRVLRLSVDAQLLVENEDIQE